MAYYFRTVKFVYVYLATNLFAVKCSIKFEEMENNLASEEYTTGSDRQYCEIYYHQQNQGYSFRKKSQISIYFEIVDGYNPTNYNLHKNHFSY